MGVPVAAKDRPWIEAPFFLEEFLDAWMAGGELPGIGPSVIGEVVAAAVLDRAVDQTAEIGRGFRDAFGRVLDVQVEDDAGPTLTGPREHGLVVILDHADGAVDDVDAVLPGIRTDRVHELPAARAGARRAL